MTTRHLLQPLAVYDREQRDHGAAQVSLQTHGVYSQPHRHHLHHPHTGRRSVRLLNTPLQVAEESPRPTLSTFITPGT